MSYRVAVRKEGQDEVVIQVDPKNFKIESDYEGGLCVEVEYSKYRLLHGDPDGYDAITYAWPGDDELVLYRRVPDTDPEEWEEVFVGTVSKVDTDDHEIVIAARREGDVPTEPITIDVIEDTNDDTRRGVLVASDNEGGAVVVDWGDGTPHGSNLGDGADRTAHQYASPGAYTITVYSSDVPARTASQDVTVPFPFAALTVDIQEDTEDPTRQSLRLTADNDGQGPLIVDFGDGTLAVNVGDGVEVDLHTYAAPGDYTVKVISDSDPLRVVETLVTVPYTA